MEQDASVPKALLQLQHKNTTLHGRLDLFCVFATERGHNVMLHGRISSSVIYAAAIFSHIIYPQLWY